MAYFTQHKRSSVPFLRPLRAPSTVCAYIHEKFALLYYILFSMCTCMQYNGSPRPAFGSLFSRVFLLCSHLSDMQHPRVHLFTADSSSWLLGLKLRWPAMQQVLSDADFHVLGCILKDSWATRQL